MPNNGDKDLNWGRYLGVGLEMLVGVVLGYFVGRWIGIRFGAQETGEMIGAMIGVAGGMYLLIKDAIQANKN
jgi:hypothetical protein